MMVILNAFQMTQDEVPVRITEMHTITSAITPIATALAVFLAHPLTIPVRYIAILPYLHKVILIDISLIVIRTDTGTSRNGTVCHHRTYRHTCMTVEEQVADLSFIILMCSSIIFESSS